MNRLRKKNPYIADNLRFVRMALNLSQKYMADKMGVERSTYSAYEIGKTEPSLYQLKCIIDIFNEALNKVAKGYVVDYDSLLTEQLNFLTVKNICNSKTEKSHLPFLHKKV